jgi:hypothetical protein
MWGDSILMLLPVAIVRGSIDVYEWAIAVKKTLKRCFWIESMPMAQITPKPKQLAGRCITLVVTLHR